MKIDHLEIHNFRGIKQAVFPDLGDTVVIAGPNGSGKSCVFDAIRFLKSLYGGYQQNEVQQWLAEFMINPARLQQDIIRLFNEKSRDLRITAAFSFSDDEKSYINSKAAELLSEVIWRSIIPEAFNYGFYSAIQYSAQFRERQPEVNARLQAELPQLHSELAMPSVTGELVAQASGQITLRNSKLLSVIFNSYRPPHIGVIDYHGALRLYGRENVQNITLSFEQNNQDQRRQSSLYNYNAKYSNVKAEMAASYVKDILSREANPNDKSDNSLTDTLKQLFSHFFPEKEFMGPVPTQEGNLSFPVKVGSGIHDLDELSAGEKEVLYGYLRMRNSAPRHSIILLDEPELHLNPRLIRGLPQFYRQHLSLALHNQMWLVSHSDALLREVVGKNGYNVFHMLPCTSPGAESGQLRTLHANEELEVAIVDLVGDVAAYKPGAKAIIFEGGGDSDFDQRFVANIFPALSNSVNLISGANKVRVRALVETLDRAQKRGDFPTKFFAITDKDFEDDSSNRGVINQFSWDVYHIENYLLEPSFIASVWQSLGRGSDQTDDRILDDLRSAARDIEPRIIRQSMMELANSSIVSKINVGFDPAAEDVSGSIFNAVQRSVGRIDEAISGELKLESLREKEASLRQKFADSFADGSWRQTLPGRDILSRYVGAQNPGIAYEPFRNLIMSKMADAGYQPEGMKHVISQILAA